MTGGFRRWYGRRGPGAGGRLPVGLLVAVALLFTLQEVIGAIVSEAADGALFGLPWWLRIVVVAVLVGIAGVVYTVVNPSRDPAPDPPSDPSAVLTVPAPPAGYVGRAAELSTVVDLSAADHTTAVVGGRGVGTSAFVLRVAQEIRSLFPDGQVYVDVRGAEAGGGALSAAEVLYRVMHLVGLGEPSGGRGDRLDAAAEELHAWLSSRAVLLVLDNVDRRDQVRRLIGAAPNCRVLLAGSVDLERLDTVRTFHLSDLDTADAVELLGLAANDPQLATRERAVAETLVNRCSRQPLAVRLVGELIRDRRWTLDRAASAVAAGLRAPGDTGGGDVAALQPLWDACDLTYRDLPAPARRVFRLLALVPSTEIGTAAAAAVAGLQPAAAAAQLEVLARRGLVESVRPDRYRTRQMLSASAWRYLADDARWRLRRASLRLVRHYATLAEEYADQLSPGDVRDRATEVRAQQVREARAWFRQEREVLFRLATTEPVRVGLSPAVTAWQQRLAVALCVWLARDGRLSEWEAVCRAVLAGRIGPNPRTVEFWARNELAAVRRRTRDARDAARLLGEAAKLCRGRYHRGMAQARTNHGLALLDLGEVTAAVGHLDAGLTLRPRGDLAGRAMSALGLGVAYLRAGDPAVARRYLVDSLNHFDDSGDPRGMAAAFNNLGVVLWRQGDQTGAREHWKHARDLFADVEDPAGLASATLNEAAAVLTGSADTAEAAAMLALLSDGVRRTDGRPPTRTAGLLHLYLGDALDRTGDRAGARGRWQRALDLLTVLADADPDAGPDPDVAAARDRLAPI